MISIQEYSGRDVAVFGLARSGLSAAKALHAGGANVFAWDDSEPARARAESEGVTVRDINARDWRGFAALVLSPGVPLTFPQPHRVVELAKAVGVPIISDVELFARAVNARPAHARPKIIGVTGTNGKSTTAALITHILEVCGKDARLGGNIGRGVLDLPPLHAGAIYVLELSSYQLDLVESLRCDIALFLNFAPDHLDRHGDLASYFAAKQRVLRNQGAGDYAIIGVDNAETARLLTQITAKAACQAIPISNRQALGRGVCVLGGRVYDGLNGRAHPVLDLTGAPALLGAHNGQNAAAAYAAARAMGLEARRIAAAIETFPGLAHRLERAGEIQGVRFVNDSKATNPDAAKQALSSFAKVRWIAGGRAKEGGIDALASYFPKITKAYLIGEAGPSFARTLAGQRPVQVCADLAHAIRQAYADAQHEGDHDSVVLLSPACASFDQFRDFEHRGECFKAEVRKLDAELSLDPAPAHGLPKASPAGLQLDGAA